MMKPFKPPQKQSIEELHDTQREIRSRQKALVIEVDQLESQIKFLQNVIEGKEKALCQQSQ